MLCLPRQDFDCSLYGLRFWPLSSAASFHIFCHVLSYIASSSGQEPHQWLCTIGIENIHGNKIAVFPVSSQLQITEI